VRGSFLRYSLIAEEIKEIRESVVTFVLLGETKGSRRRVGLTKRGTEALLRHRARQADEGMPVGGDALVFTNTVGKPKHQSNFIRRSFKPLLK
jgi:hypothetical protein